MVMEGLWEPGTETSDQRPAQSKPTGTRALSLLTESRLKSRRRCAREHHLRYELGYEATTEREALRFGTLMHAALEAWWRAPDGRLGAALSALASVEIDPFERVRLEELITGYHVRWSDEGYETLAVELEFRVPLINPETRAASKTWEHGGKLDAIARDRAGRVVIVEHKTSAEDIGPGSVYWARLRMDGQVSGYFRGARSIGYDAEACLYDVIGKVKLRPLQATPPELRKYTKPTKAEPVPRLYTNQRETDETVDEYRLRVREEIAGNPDRYYQRGEVVRLEEEMRAHDVDAWQMAQTMRDERRLGIAPRNPDACSRFGSLCQFFDVCSGAASLDDESRFKKLPTVHPELSVVSNPKEEG